MMQGDTAAPVSALHGLVWTALMAALLGVGAFLHIPFPPVPFTMQTFFVLLAGFLLGPANGALAVVLYLAAGIAGLPVFSGGKAGIFHVLGPTGGFLLGFLICAVLCGMASHRRRGRPRSTPGWIWQYFWGLAGLLALFSTGIIWLKLWLGENASLAESALSMLPFFGIDCAKLGAVVPAYRFLLRLGLAPR